MRKPIIQKLIGREILDSRGNPTLEVATILCDGTVGLCAVPAGASRGQYEAIEHRDGDPARYGGLGVTAAARSVREIFSPLLCGMNAAENQRIDRRLLAADGTAQKEKYGGNTLLGVSLSVARAAAAFYRLPLYRYLGGAAARRLPVPMMNLINGGAHAANRLDIQEFMVVPVGAPSFREALRWGSEIRRALGKLLSDAGYATGVGDEGGFAPDLPDERAALDFLMAAVAAAGYENKGVKIALDIASSEWTAEDGLYHLPKEGSSLTREALTARLSALIADYPILSLEDPLGEEDFEGWAGLTGTLGDRVTLVGDDLFVTDPARLAHGIRTGAANAVLVKPNQNGTLSGTLSFVEKAQKAGYRVILSHRSGETEDTTVADLAVAVGAPFIKAGAPCRGERVAKYNRLLRIEETLTGVTV